MPRLLFFWWLWAAGIFLAACAPVSAPKVADPALLRERFLLDQEWRRQGLRAWGVEGVLSWEEEERERRRARFTALGEGGERMRLAVMGPFRQVAMQWLVDGPVLRLMRHGEKEVTEVPATAAGMRRIAQVPLPPSRLIASLLGFAAVTGGWSAGGAPEWDGGDGEILLLDPVSARIQKRRGRVDDHTVYGVDYLWPERDEGLFARPAEVRVTLTEEATGKITRLGLELSEWRLPREQELTVALTPELPPGFRLLRPLAPDAGTGL